MNKMDIFLQPLVDKLLELWNVGVHALDFSKQEGNHSFTLQATVMWTINDFPCYGLLSSCVHQRYVACPICGPETMSHHSRALKKFVYMGHCRWLRQQHPYQMQMFNNAFNSKFEHKVKPPQVTGDEVLARGMEYACWINIGNGPRGVGDPSKKHEVKRQSILYNLPYFKVINLI
jgi:hypothetical protein